VVSLNEYVEQPRKADLERSRNFANLETEVLRGLVLIYQDFTSYS